MQSHTLPRLLLVGFMFALIAAGTLRYNAAAAEVDIRDSSTTQSQENVPVQKCGDSDITASYTTTREYVRYGSPAIEPVYEIEHVNFTGSIGNATSGKSYEYAGHYSRTVDFTQSSVWISDLLLRFEIGTPGEFTYSLANVDFDLGGNPAAVVQAIVPNALHMDLCYLLGGPAASVNLAPGQPVNVHTENSALDQSETISRLPEPSVMHTENSALDQPAESIDHMTNWSELDPCDTSPPGKSC
jgi:hypothetical protein